MSGRNGRSYEAHTKELSRRDRSVSPRDDRRYSKHSEYRTDRAESSSRLSRDREYSKSHRREKERSKSPKKSKKKKSKKSKKKSRSESSSEDSEDEEKRPDQAGGGYSNVDNPFNDVNLTSKFKWAKKERKDIKSGLSRKELERRENERKEEARLELEKLNRRRQEREEELEFREQEQMRLQREADLVQLGDWEAREDEFHLEQAKRRAEIRIKDRRAKAIDVLAINLKLAYEGDDDEEHPLEISLDEPYTVFNTLSLPEADDLKKDIQLYLSLEREEVNKQFWTDMMVVCEAKLEELRSASLHLPSRIPLQILEQIDQMLSAKTLPELNNLQLQIIAKLNSNLPIDTDYWEQTLKAITVWKAKVRLRAHHEIVLSKRLDQLRSRQLEEAQQDCAVTLHSQQPEPNPEMNQCELIPKDPSMGPGTVPSSHHTRADKGLPLLNPASDLQQLLAGRKEVQSGRRAARPERLEEAPPAQDVGASAQDFAARLFRQEKEDQQAKATGDELDIDEEIFDLEVHLDAQPLAHSNKYQPRKPMYFNRVHTGYEWNKYNQTHYDGDNPPPKVVQGYKFHIFYPGLLKDPETDRVPTPTYRLEPDPLSPDTQVLRFSAGPPYQDIAFRIVRREWEYSHKKGFKSAFINHTLYLYFHFKRHYYRR
ncbi:hypothetical protein DSO57_1007583 [Entomophthora muscae]|uniref:Uncharacterized protein n=1 Tax=Entomophthora muscae TaxID=34485 RepID=A0ACC2S939_9FUNG|nr:hypothetical protein DSO57_1007583 [Entomophthora muscae]